jgi:hypothetical protein
MNHDPPTNTRLVYVSNNTVCVLSEGYHVLKSTNIPVNRMVRQIQGNVGRAPEGEAKQLEEGMEGVRQMELQLSQHSF